MANKTKAILRSNVAADLEGQFVELMALRRALCRIMASRLPAKGARRASVGRGRQIRKAR